MTADVARLQSAQQQLQEELSAFVSAVEKHKEFLAELQKHCTHSRPEYASVGGYPNPPYIIHACPDCGLIRATHSSVVPYPFKEPCRKVDTTRITEIQKQFAPFLRNE